MTCHLFIVDVLILIDCAVIMHIVLFHAKLLPIFFPELFFHSAVNSLLVLEYKIRLSCYKESAPISLQFVWSLELIALRACAGVWPDSGLDFTCGLIKRGVMKREQAEGSSMVYFDSPDLQSSTNCLEERELTT